MGCTIDSKNPTSPRISAITINCSTNSQDFGPAYVFTGPISATNGPAAIISAKNSPISSYGIASICAAAISVCFEHAQSIIFYSSCGPTSTSYEFKSASDTNSLATSSAASVFIHCITNSTSWSLNSTIKSIRICFEESSLCTTISIYFKPAKATVSFC